MDFKFEYMDTKGRLNTINELYKLNTTKDISISDIIKTYNPSSEEELLAIITPEKIVELGKQLYNAAIKENHQTTLQECINYQYSLFIVNSMKGFLQEKQFHKLYPNAKQTPSDIDAKYSTDFVLDLKNKIILINIKPESYMRSTNEARIAVREINRKKMNKFKSKLEFKYPDKSVYTINIIYNYYKEWLNLENLDYLIDK